MEFGADVNHQSLVGATALHECLFRGNIECLKKILIYKPKSDLILYHNGRLPIDGVFRDNMHEILNFILTDEETIALIGDDPFLTVH